MRLVGRPNPGVFILVHTKKGKRFIYSNSRGRLHQTPGLQYVEVKTIYAVKQLHKAIANDKNTEHLYLQITFACSSFNSHAHCNSNPILLMILHPGACIKSGLLTAKRLLILFFLVLVFIEAKAQPIISSFSPLSGPAGTIVTITGNNFSTNTAENIVYFGLVRGEVISANSTSIQAVVPVNASGHLLTVTINSKTASASRPFLITYNGSGHSISKEAYKAEIKIPLYRRNKEGESGYFNFYTMATADFDADGKIDMVSVGGNDDSLVVARNTTTNGHFTFDSSFIKTNTPVSTLLLTEDFNADGYADILYIHYKDTGIYILSNKSRAGQISFETTGKITKHNRFSYSQFTTGDFNQDGLIDLVIWDVDSTAAFFYKNISSNGTISFAPKQKIYTYQDPGFVVSSFEPGASSGDLNNDGKKDLIIFLAPAIAGGGDYHGEMIVLQNKGTAGQLLFEKATSVRSRSPFTPFEIFTADMNGDGFNDLLQTSNLDFHELDIYLNSGSNQTIGINPMRTQYYGYSNHIRTIPHPISYDLNGDTKIDIFLSTQYHDYDSLACYIYLFENKSSNGSLQLGAEIEMIKNGVHDMSVADLNNDSKPEIFYIRHNYYNGSDTLIILENQPQLTTSVNEPNSDGFLFSFYPNPAEHQLVIQVPAVNSPSVIMISNQLGQEVKRFQLNRNSSAMQTLDVSGLMPGMYLVTWTDGKRKQSKQLFIR